MVNSKHLPLAILTFSSSDCAISTVLFDVPFHVFYLFLFLYRVQCRLSIGKCLRDKSSQGDCTNSLSMWHMRHSTQCIAMRLWTMFVLQTLWPRSRSNVCLHLAPWTLHQPSFFMLTNCFNTIFTQLLILSSDVMKIIWNWIFHRYLTTKLFQWQIWHDMLRLLGPINKFNQFLS